MTEGDAGLDTRGVNLAKDPTRAYLAGLRWALADLPESEVAEILDDVAGHLADVVADIEAGVGPDADPVDAAAPTATEPVGAAAAGRKADMAALTARLGTPGAYAAELRAAAGYPTGPTGPAVVPADRGARLAVVGLVGSAVLLGGVGWSYGRAGGAAVFLALVLAALSLPALLRGGPRMPAVATLPVGRWFLGLAPDPSSRAASVARYLAGLQSAWWLLRAFVAAVLVAGVLGGGTAAVVLVALLAAPLSVWVGYRSRADRRWLWVVVPLNALAAALALITPFATQVGSQPSYGTSSNSYPGGLIQDGVPIRDVRPVDANGTALSGVYLFDQDGRPIDTGQSCWDDLGDGAPFSDGDSFSIGGSGAEVQPYPRGTREYDPRTGRCETVVAPPLLVAIPRSGAPSASASPSAEVLPSTPPVTGVPTPPAPTPPAPLTTAPVPPG